jgi:hypothetical protein
MQSEKKKSTLSKGSINFKPAIMKKRFNPAIRNMSLTL